MITNRATKQDYIQLQNKKSNAQGRHFEDYIEKACNIYREKGIANIKKVPEPFRVTKLYPNGTFTGRFIAKAEPDFKGTLKNGRSIVFEAKMTSKDRIMQNVLTDAQARALENHSILGAYTGVCVNIQDSYYFIPYGIWANMKEIYGRKYLTRTDIEVYEVDFNCAVMFLNYKNKE
ncbi:hypothetical protein HMPREF9630_00230 [Peptoanaerobacter stomatis]|uniref:Holliday junction resolvase RecU n=1 Tax=Peptoanaerobacter stomatis TaxID=796937 RepID=V9HRS2_9FIRM|nr:Holliday junction resolvase RecU [Peptoanaerobacter stomatis]EHL18505.1 hypothetical protein HMPREF9630_00230 [Peptoanaerobacter stomatis]